MTDEQIFAQRDTYLMEHPEIVTAMKASADYERYLREMQRPNIYQATWRDGKLIDWRELDWDEEAQL